MRWSTAALGDVCEVVSGATPRTAEKRFWDGNILWTTPKDISDLDGPYLERTSRTITEEGLKSCAASVLPANSVLLSSRAPIGLVAINSAPMATNQGYKSLVPNRNSVDSKFLFYWLKSKTEYLQGLGNGATFKEISKAVVERIEIPVPPLDEQRRIAAILDKADALRRKRRRAVKLFDDLPHSTFLNAFGTQEGYVTKQLSSVTTDIYRYPAYYGIQYESQGIPEIRGELIRDDGTMDSDPSLLRYISPATSSRFPKTVLKAGDLVMSVRGTIGKIGIVPDHLAGANITANLIRIAPNRQVIEPIFLWFAMRSASTLTALAGISTSTTIATVKASDLRNLPIVYPPMAEQRRFVALAGVQANLRRAAALHLLKAELLFSSLQSRAFSGQL